MSAGYFVINKSGGFTGMKKKVITALCALVILGLILAGVLIYVTMKKKTVGKSEIDMSEFALPDGATWEGSYIDRIDSLAVLTITRKGNDYLCSVGIPSDDMSFVDSYEFVARPAADGVGLAYENGTHIQYLISDSESSVGVVDTELYSDGSGSLYYYKGAVLWVDNVADAGSGYLFEKQEEVTDGPAD